MSKHSKDHLHHLGVHHPRGVGVLHEQLHDPYRSESKYPDETQCPQCGAVVDRGIWKWTDAEHTIRAAISAVSSESRNEQRQSKNAEGHQRLCPACHRLAVDDPVGILIIDAAILAGRAAEIRSVIEREVAEESAGHPLERLMRTEERETGDWWVHTTGLHALRRVGHALEKLTHQQLLTRYAHEQHKALMHLRVREPRKR